MGLDLIDELLNGGNDSTNFKRHHKDIISKIYSYEHDPVYTEIRIPKQDGSHRVVYDADLKTKEVQRLLLHILNSYYDTVKPSYVYGFVKGVDYKNMFTQFDKKEIDYIITLDVKNFFPSLSTEDLKRLMPAELKVISKSIYKYCTLNKKLVQGACTSPALSNILMVKFDLRMRKFFSRYSRYADDMIIPMTEFQRKRCIEPGGKDMVPTAIEQFKKANKESGLNLKINYKKVNMYTVSHNAYVLGIRYKRYNHSIGWQYKNHIKISIYKYSKNELDEVETQVLRGKIAYLKHFEPQVYTKFLINSFRKHEVDISKL